jgi:endonuclease YncB( thermonuclease family)
MASKKNVIYFCVFALLALTMVLVEFEPTHRVPDSTSPATNATALNCSDGDTCRIKYKASDSWMNVRLFGIDAPETPKKRSKRKNGQGQPNGQPKGLEARDFLNDLIKDKDIRVVQMDLDHYNRPVVEIFLGSESVNLMLVEQGLAEAYKGRTKGADTERFLEAESQAKHSKTGIWAMSDYESPASFRKRTR